MGSKNTAFEADAETIKKENGDSLHAAALYPEGDSLDKHLSPMAMAKLKEFFDKCQDIDHLMKYRPWAIASELDSDLLNSLQLVGHLQKMGRTHFADSCCRPDL